MLLTITPQKAFGHTIAPHCLELEPLVDNKSSTYVSVFLPQNMRLKMNTTYLSMILQSWLGSAGQFCYLALIIHVAAVKWRPDCAGQLPMYVW